MTSTSLPSAGPVDATERVDTLDVLRGIALSGMILVHFIEWGGAPQTAFGRELETINSWFFVDRFMTMFAILFGAGFAVQLSRAEVRGDGFGWRYVRRLLALVVFGIIAEDLFGFRILLSYALWGFPLFFVRKWSNRALFITLIVCLLAIPLYWGGRAAYDLATGGEARYRDDVVLCSPPLVIVPSFSASKECADARAKELSARRAAGANRPVGYIATVRDRFARTWDKHAHPTPWFYLPGGTLCLFLIGVLFFRMGVFQRPQEHRRLIVTLMVLGAASSVLGGRLLWDFMHSPDATSLSLPMQFIGGLVLLALLVELWFSFVYIGAVLLLVAGSRDWLTRLRAFGITGRMALTNYIVQAMVLDLTMSREGLRLQPGPEFAPLLAAALFGLQLAFSAWWLRRYRYGPLEWIWRSVTYWKAQPLTR